MESLPVEDDDFWEREIEKDRKFEAKKPPQSNTGVGEPKTTSRTITKNSTNLWAWIFFIGLCTCVFYLNQKDAQIKQLKETIASCSDSIDRANYSIYKLDLAITGFQVSENISQYYQLKQDLQDFTSEPQQPNPCSLYSFAQTQGQ